MYVDIYMREQDSVKIKVYSLFIFYYILLYFIIIYSLIKKRSMLLATSKTHARIKSALLRKMHVRTVHTARPVSAFQRAERGSRFERAMTTYACVHV